jgi:hypothetical protein
MPGSSIFPAARGAADRLNPATTPNRRGGAAPTKSPSALSFVGATTSSRIRVKPIPRSIGAGACLPQNLLRPGFLWERRPRRELGLNQYRDQSPRGRTSYKISFGLGICGSDDLVANWVCSQLPQYSPAVSRVLGSWRLFEPRNQLPPWLVAPRNILVARAL